jgi:DNA-binding XRE family transcriptional regulator
MSKKIPKGPLQPIGRLSLNLPLREIRFGDRVVLLSKAEIQVVAQLFARPGELIDTPELALGMVGNPSLSCIRSYLWRVRQKLEAVGAKGYLPVRYGYGSGGFALIDPDRESQPADTAGRRPHRRKPGGPHPFAQPTIEGFDPAKFRADRLAAGLTLTALAAASGVSRRTLSDWECVRQTPSPRVFQRVLDALRGDS